MKANRTQPIDYRAIIHQQLGALMAYHRTLPEKQPDDDESTTDPALYALLVKDQEEEITETAARILKIWTNKPKEWCSLTDSQRKTLFRNFRLDVVHDRANAILQERKAQPQRSKGTMVKLFKDGKDFAVQTNASDERQFVEEFSIAFAQLIGDHPERVAPEWATMLEHWLTPFVEICCKLRGYKSGAQEQRIITAGALSPNKDSLTIEIDERGNFLQEIRKPNGAMA